MVIRGFEKFLVGLKLGESIRKILLLKCGQDAAAACTSWLDRMIPAVTGKANACVLDMHSRPPPVGGCAARVRDVVRTLADALAIPLAEGAVGAKAAVDADTHGAVCTARQAAGGVVAAVGRQPRVARRWGQLVLPAAYRNGWW